MLSAEVFFREFQSVLYKPSSLEDRYPCRREKPADGAAITSLHVKTTEVGRAWEGRSREEVGPRGKRTNL